MNYTREQLITALIGEYERLCHDDPPTEENGDMTEEEYAAWVKTLTLEELVKESSWDTEEEILEYIEAFT